jgi:hypothetical protein
MKNAIGLFSVKNHAYDPFFWERARAKPVPALREWEAIPSLSNNEQDASADPPDEHERTTDLDTQPQAT